MLFEVSLKSCKPHMHISIRKRNFSWRMSTLFCFWNVIIFHICLSYFFNIHIRAFISVSNYCFCFFTEFDSSLESLYQRPAGSFPLTNFWFFIDAPPLLATQSLTPECTSTTYVAVHPHNKMGSIVYGLFMRSNRISDLLKQSQIFKQKLLQEFYARN